jgi:hypothetical protein
VKKPKVDIKIMQPNVVNAKLGDTQRCSTQHRVK